jgi:cellulose synthase/poly-beta-1,6-N-acetylglucosamine synthase-like glycosyltransferase
VEAPVPKARLKSLRKLFWRTVGKQPTVPPQASLNQKMLAFIDRNSNRAMPVRETTFHPEILIPCFNHAQYLTHLLEVLQGSNIPITVIDDHSDDKNRLLIEDLGRRFHVKVIRNDSSLRQSGSLNKAIRLSDNNLFIVANADDYLLPGWVPYAIEQFRRRDIYLLGGMHMCFFNHFPQSEPHFVNLLRSSAYTPSSEFRLHGPEDARCFTHDNSIDMTMTGCSFLKSAWEFVGGFYSLVDRVSDWDDRDFQMRVCAFFPVAVSDDLSALWRSNSSTGMGNK